MGVSYIRIHMAILNPLYYSRIMTLSAMKTGVCQLLCSSVGENWLDIKKFSMDNHSIFGKPVKEISDIELYNYMRLFNAHYIVSCEEQLREKL